MTSALSQVLRLAGDSTSLAVEGGGGDQDEKGTSTVGAASIIPGMVVSHPVHTSDKKVTVLHHSHRGTHVEVVGKSSANGRGALIKVPPSTQFTLHGMSGADKASLPSRPEVSLGPTMAGST